MILPLLVALSSQLLAPTSKNFPETSEAPMVEQAAPIKYPNATRAPRLSWKPGSYALDSLKLPDTLTMESFEQWSGGPNWPSVEAGVVVVTDSVDDPARFMAFLIDVKLQRIAAVRDGDKAKHLMTVGQLTPAKGDGSAVPPIKMSLAGSGAVIILRPPVPPGPSGVPDGLVAKILDAGAIASQAYQWVAKVG